MTIVTLVSGCGNAYPGLAGGRPAAQDRSGPTQAREDMLSEADADDEYRASQGKPLGKA